MNKKIGCFIGATIALFGGVLLLNYSSEWFPLVVFLELVLGWVFGFLFRKFVDSEAILRRDNEIVRLNNEILSLEHELKKAKESCNPVIEVKLDDSAKKAEKPVKASKAKSTKGKKVEKRVIEQSKI